MMSVKKGTKKNYGKLIFILVLSVVAILLLAKGYQTYQEMSGMIPVIRNTLAELSPQDLETYLLENEDIILYVGSSNNEACRTLEKEMIPWIEENQLQNRMMYLNITSEDDKIGYIQRLQNTYQSNQMLDREPLLLRLENGKIEEAITSTSTSTITLDEVKAFVEKD